MALGMESGKISDDQITASTSFYDNRWLPRQARLNNDDNAWTPAEDSNKEYIQVSLREVFPRITRRLSLELVQAGLHCRDQSMSAAARSS